jgi:succinyl-diaminopimelate desuccinylase
MMNVDGSQGLTTTELAVLDLIDAGEVTAFLQALIRQRSDFPPGDCRGAVGVVQEKLDRANVPYQLLFQQEHQPNLIASLGGQVGPCLMYHAHIDTVPAGDVDRWSCDPFGAELRDGLLYGRGAGDDKGSVAAQVMAIVTLARSGVKLARCLKLAIVSDEESGALQGTHWLHQAGILKPDVLVVGEQTANQVAVAERVACGIDLTVYGKSVHGAMPWAGENAILKTAGALAWLRERLFPALDARRHPNLPPPTLNIGKIQGGIQWNIVPGSCKVEMDRRLVPGETREMAMAEIRKCLDEYAAQVEPLTYELFSGGEVAANIDTSPNDPFVRLANRSLADVCGEARPIGGYMQTSDGRWFARDGIPIIIFGPSDPAFAHGPDEHVSIAQLVEATRFLVLLALRWHTDAN